MSAEMVSREKYFEALDKAHKFKNMWHNTHQELAGYKKHQSVSNESLRELIERWEGHAASIDMGATDTYKARAETWQAAADELKELVDGVE